VRKRENILNEYKRRDVIEDYTSYNSEAYAPLTRHGSFPDKNADNYQVRNKYLDTFQGLLELEASLPPFVLQVNMKPPKRVVNTKDGYMKRKFREQKRLDDIYTVSVRLMRLILIENRILIGFLNFQDIAGEKAEIEKEEKPLRFLKLVEKPIPRPPTPQMQLPDDVNIKQYLFNSIDMFINFFC
jgi:hypothetical protein